MKEYLFFSHLWSKDPAVFLLQLTASQYAASVFVRNKGERPCNSNASFHNGYLLLLATINESLKICYGALGQFNVFSM